MVPFFPLLSYRTVDGRKPFSPVIVLPRKKKNIAFLVFRFTRFRLECKESGFIPLPVVVILFFREFSFSDKDVVYFRRLKGISHTTIKQPGNIAAHNTFLISLCSLSAQFLYYDPVTVTISHTFSRGNRNLFSSFLRSYPCSYGNS